MHKLGKSEVARAFTVYVTYLWEKALHFIMKYEFYVILGPEVIFIQWYFSSSISIMLNY